MILGAMIVTITYVLANVAYLRLLPVPEMAASRAVAADALSGVLPSGGLIVAILIAVSTFGTIGIFTMSAPRIYYTMARDGRFFRLISRLHPKRGTPVFAILLQSAWALVLLVFWGTFEDLIAYVVFMDWVFMILAAVSLFVFRRKMGPARSFRVPGYPLIPLIFIGISVWFVIYTSIGQPQQALWGTALLVIGLPVYLVSQKGGRNS